MSAATALAGAVVGGLLIRQLMVLSAILRSRIFLRGATSVQDDEQETGSTFFVILPVLREAGGITEAIEHFEMLTQGHAAQLLVVTTAREAAEAERFGGADTLGRVEELAVEGKFIHLCSPDAAGLKGDQLNFAAKYCASTLLGDVQTTKAFVVCYDVDSRPPLDSLSQFTEAARSHPEASVFHQSSRFEARGAPTQPSLSRALAEGAALRANRFVLGFELPRLINRSSLASRVKRRICSLVYAHVTGHGLCIRLSLLLDLPFPARSPLEDMYYSFYLGSRNLPMIAVPSLDRAEVPSTLASQVDQAARWFNGPARFRRYLTDPVTVPGWRSRMMALSAVGSSLEWLGCAIVPPLAIAFALLGPESVRTIALLLVGTYFAQLVVTDAVLGSNASVRLRLLRVAVCPLATILFGIGGFIGAGRLLKGSSVVGKTERP